MFISVIQFANSLLEICIWKVMVERFKSWLCSLTSLSSLLVSYEKCVPKLDHREKAKNTQINLTTFSTPICAKVSTLCEGIFFLVKSTIILLDNRFIYIFCVLMCLTSKG